MTLEVEVPENFGDLGFTQEELEREVPLLLVLKCYREGAISSGKAARLLSMTRVEFLDLLGREGIPIFNLTKDELAAEFATARRLAEERS